MKEFSVKTTGGMLLIAADTQEEANLIAKKDGHQIKYMTNKELQIAEMYFRILQNPPHIRLEQNQLIIGNLTISEEVKDFPRIGGTIKGLVYVLDEAVYTDSPVHGMNVDIIELYQSKMFRNVVIEAVRQYVKMFLENYESN